MPGSMLERTIYMFPCTWVIDQYHQAYCCAAKNIKGIKALIHYYWKFGFLKVINLFSPAVYQFSVGSPQSEIRIFLMDGYVQLW
jgi:hypothetical protein